jgi:hypothetical protein
VAREDDSKKRVKASDALSDRNEGEMPDNEEGWLKEEGENGRKGSSEREREEVTVRPGEVHYDESNGQQEMRGNKTKG